MTIKEAINRLGSLRAEMELSDDPEVRSGGNNLKLIECALGMKQSSVLAEVCVPYAKSLIKQIQELRIENMMQ